ncbi:MAG TPA: hypothetical protein VIJ57_02910, partial [Hanamia sp.]
MKLKFGSCLIVMVILFTFPSFAQVKKESTSVKIDFQKDTLINFKKPQKSITQGSVTVEGKRISYEAIAGMLVLKNELDSPTITMSYVSYSKNDEKDAS